MAAEKSNQQYAPWPGDLEALVAMVRYRDGWRFWLQHEERDRYGTDPESGPADTHGQAAGGLTLTITTKTANSYHPSTCETCGSTVTNYRVRHLFPVPAATWDRQGWLDWLMDCIEQVELHEAREFFRLEYSEIVDVHVENDTVERQDRSVVLRPFAPNHGPGRDPYRRYSYATDADRRTSFRGITDRRTSFRGVTS